MFNVIVIWSIQWLRVAGSISSAALRVLVLLSSASRSCASQQRLAFLCFSSALRVLVVLISASRSCAYHNRFASMGLSCRLISSLRPQFIWDSIDLYYLIQIDNINYSLIASLQRSESQSPAPLLRSASRYSRRLKVAGSYSAPLPGVPQGVAS